LDAVGIVAGTFGPAVLAFVVLVLPARRVV
jgi:hypothetical protein